MERRIFASIILATATGLQSCGGGDSSNSQTAEETTSIIQAMRAAQQDAYFTDANALIAQYAAQGRRISTIRGVSDLFVDSIVTFLQRAFNYVTTRPGSDRDAVRAVLDELKAKDKTFINSYVTEKSALSSTQLADFLVILDSRIDTTYSASGLM